jgi:GR25 family glycosyltransferase involved in LPS biosynthesis
VPVFLINLDVRRDRWDAAQARLLAQGLRPERFAALTGQEALDRGYCVVRPEREQSEWHVGAGALGCAASHLEIYRRVATTGGDGAVIMEDDVLLAADFVERATYALHDRAPGTDVVSLGWLFYENSVRSRVVDAAYRMTGRRRRDRLSVEPFGFGTHCYWVSQQFATAATQLMNPVFAPIDAMIRAFTHYSSWQSEAHWPPLATQDATGSDIR